MKNKRQYYFLGALVVAIVVAAVFGSSNLFKGSIEFVRRSSSLDASRPDLIIDHYEIGLANATENPKLVKIKVWIKNRGGVDIKDRFIQTKIGEIPPAPGHVEQIGVNVSGHRPNLAAGETVELAPFLHQRYDDMAPMSYTICVDSGLDFNTRIDESNENNNCVYTTLYPSAAPAVVAVPMQQAAPLTVVPVVPSAPAIVTLPAQNTATYIPEVRSVAKPVGKPDLIVVSYHVDTEVAKDNLGVPQATATVSAKIKNIGKKATGSLFGVWVVQHAERWTTSVTRPSKALNPGGETVIIIPFEPAPADQAYQYQVIVDSEVNAVRGVIDEENETNNVFPPEN